MTFRPKALNVIECQWNVNECQWDGSLDNFLFIVYSTIPEVNHHAEICQNAE